MPVKSSVIENAPDVFELAAPKERFLPPTLEDYAFAARLGFEIKELESDGLASLYKAYGDYVQELVESKVVNDEVLHKQDALSRRIGEIKSELLRKSRAVPKDGAIYFSKLTKTRIKVLGILRAIELNDIDVLKKRLKNVSTKVSLKPQYVLYSFSSEILRDLLAMGLVKEVSEHTPNRYRDVDFKDNIHFYLPEQEHLQLLFTLKAALPESCQFNGARHARQKAMIESMSLFELRLLVQNGLAECLTTEQFNELRTVGDEIQELFSVTSALTHEIESMGVEDCSTRILLITQMIALMRLEDQMETLQLRRRHRKHFTKIDDGLYIRISDAGIDELVRVVSEDD